MSWPVFFRNYFLSNFMTWRFWVMDSTMVPPTAFIVSRGLPDCKRRGLGHEWPGYLGHSESENIFQKRLYQKTHTADRGAIGFGYWAGGFRLWDQDKVAIPDSTTNVWPAVFCRDDYIDFQREAVSLVCTRSVRQALPWLPFLGSFWRPKSSTEIIQSWGR